MIGPAKSEIVPLRSITIDARTQVRAEIVTDAVDDYAAAIERSKEAFPPVELVRDQKTHWIVDGFHRVLAYQKLGIENIPANVYQGEHRDAVLLAVGANAQHGMRRTNADKRRAVEIMLRDEEWQHWSDRAIAEQCHVHHSLVGAVRKELHPPGGFRQVGATRKGRDGKRYAPKPKGKQPAAPPKPAGKSQVNGVVVDDPPDVADLRRAGKIAPDAVPVVDEPEPSVVEPEPESVEDDLDDAAWLETLPARADLSPVSRKKFDADAIAYRRLDPHRKAFAYHVGRIAKGDGHYSARTRWFIKTDHPKHWLVCPAPEFDGCGGTGQLPTIGPCMKCRGKGYWIK